MIKTQFKQKTRQFLPVTYRELTREQIKRGDADSSVAFFLSPHSRLHIWFIANPTLTRGAIMLLPLRGFANLAVKRPKHVAIGVSLW